MKGHTPGPWNLGSQNDQLYVTAGKPPAQDNDYPNHDADRTLIAKVYGDAPQSDANGYLLAAAPDLLDALKALLIMSDRGPEPKKFDQSISWRRNDQLAHEMARAAIKKATQS